MFGSRWPCWQAWRCQRRPNSRRLVLLPPPVFRTQPELCHRASYVLTDGIDAPLPRCPARRFGRRGKPLIHFWGTVLLWVPPVWPSYLPVLAPGASDSVHPALDLSLRFETKVIHPEISQHIRKFSIQNRLPAGDSSALVDALLRSQVCLQLPRWNEIKMVLLQEFFFLIDAATACFPSWNIQQSAHFFQQLRFHLSPLSPVPFFFFFWTTSRPQQRLPPADPHRPCRKHVYHVYRIWIERQSLSAHLSDAFRHL